jgi:hypothetical protein
MPTDFKTEIDAFHAIDLKPCPLDGGDPLHGTVLVEDEIIEHFIECENGDLKVTSTTQEGAASVWNSELVAQPPNPEPGPEPTPSEIRFHPTFIMAVDMGSGSGGIDAPQTGWVDQIKSLKDYPTWGAASVLLNWDDIEPNALGVYSRVITDKLRDAAHSVNKKLCIGIKFQWFGGPTNWEGKIPAYLSTYMDGKPAFSQKKSGESWNGNLTLYIWLHNERVMDRYLAMMAKLAEWYADDDVILMINFGETAVDAPAPFNTEDWQEQLERYGADIAGLFPQTERRMMVNYLGNNDSDLAQLEDVLVEHQNAMGGPDNASPDHDGGRKYSANLMALGEIDGKVRIGKVSWVSENQRPASSSGGKTTTTQQIIDHNWSGAHDKGGGTKPHYWVFNHNTDSSGGAETWSKIRDVGTANKDKLNTTNPYTTA